MPVEFVGVARAEFGSGFGDPVGEFGGSACRCRRRVSRPDRLPSRGIRRVSATCLAGAGSPRGTMSSGRPWDSGDHGVAADGGADDLDKFSEVRLCGPTASSCRGVAVHGFVTYSRQPRSQRTGPACCPAMKSADGNHRPAALDEARKPTVVATSGRFFCFPGDDLCEVGRHEATESGVPRRPARVGGIALEPRGPGLTASTWLTPIRLASKPRAEPAM